MATKKTKIMASIETKRVDPRKKEATACINFVNSKEKPLTNPKPYESETVASYKAFAFLLGTAIKNGNELDVRTDNVQMVKQLSGEYEPRAPHLQKLYKDTKAAMKKMGANVTVRYSLEVNGADSMGSAEEDAFVPLA